MTLTPLCLHPNQVCNNLNLPAASAILHEQKQNSLWDLDLAIVNPHISDVNGRLKMAWEGREGGGSQVCSEMKLHWSFLKQSGMY